MASKRARADSIFDDTINIKRHKRQPSARVRSPLPPMIGSDADDLLLAGALVQQQSIVAMAAALATLDDEDEDTESEDGHLSGQQDVDDEDVSEGASDSEDQSDTAGVADDDRQSVESLDLHDPRNMSDVALKAFPEDKDRAARASIYTGQVLEERLSSADKKVNELLDVSDRTEDRTARIEQALQNMARGQEQQFHTIMQQIHATWYNLEKRITALEQQNASGINIRVNNAQYYGAHLVAASPGAHQPPHNAVPFPATQS